MKKTLENIILKEFESIIRDKDFDDRFHEKCSCANKSECKVMWGAYRENEPCVFIKKDTFEISDINPEELLLIFKRILIAYSHAQSSHIAKTAKAHIRDYDIAEIDEYSITRNNFTLEDFYKNY